ncbi:hypothetical protein AMECASPLE_035321 [Ameca splendens]|uniref:Immunoglobulin V-set domain-containing protein n=1 Tax=Ameca splendens TaxID=208324 RepID=A0ABV0Y765_9TELE
MAVWSQQPFDVRGLTVEWKFQDVLVHRYRRLADYLDAQHQKYKGKTSLFYYEMTNGNISLKLTNVTKEDEGNYFCFVPKLCSQVRMGNITLHVDTIDENGGQGYRGGAGECFENMREKSDGNSFLDDVMTGHFHETALHLGLGLGISTTIIIIIAVLCYRFRQSGQGGGNEDIVDNPTAEPLNDPDENLEN